MYLIPVVKRHGAFNHHSLLVVLHSTSIVLVSSVSFFMPQNA